METHMASEEIEFVARPFEGLECEAELVAMRELIPLGAMPATLTEEFGGEEILFVTILPSMVAAMRREDGKLLVAMQTPTSTGDLSRDAAFRISEGLSLEPGQYYSQVDLPKPGPRLEDAIASSGELEVFEEPTFWMTAEEAEKPENKEALADARAQLVPTVEVEGHKGAYWCRMSREFLRWIRHEEPDQILDALARLRAARAINFDGAKKFAGAFRAHGLFIPVWELARGAEADELPEALDDFEKRFTEALANTEPLSYDEKRAREGLVSRQVTLR